MGILSCKDALYVKLGENLGHWPRLPSVPTSKESNVCLFTYYISPAVIALRSVFKVRFSKTPVSKMSKSMHELVRFEQGLQCVHQTIHVAE